MSFMPKPGSIVRLMDGRIAIVTAVAPPGDVVDRVWTGAAEEDISAWDIAEVIHEPEPEPRSGR